MKYAEEGMQYHIGLREGDVGRYVILPGDPKRCRKIAEYFDDAHFVADNREFVTYTGMLDGEKVSVTSTGIGGPSTAIAVEELAQIGADTFIRVGTCGGMQICVQSGDCVIATGSIRMEGTSREYAPIEFPAVADYQVVSALVQAARELEFPFHVGVAQSKDSFYGQHSPEKSPVGYELMAKWEAWKKLGCLASEMEGAALFTVGAALGVRCGAVFLTMANQEREKKGLPNPVVHDTDRAIQTAVKAIRLLIASQREEGKKMRKILEEAYKAMEHAYAPYSQYHVGACVKLKDGRYIPGANVENAAYGSSMCAERNAVYAAYSLGYRRDDIEALAIVSDGKALVTPCGACRQVLGELLREDTPIYLRSSQQERVTTIQELLPLAFDEGSLKK